MLMNFLFLKKYDYQNLQPLRFDTRDRSVAEPRHWSDSRALEGRAFFKVQSTDNDDDDNYDYYDDDNYDDDDDEDDGDLVKMIEIKLNHIVCVVLIP